MEQRAPQDVASDFKRVVPSAVHRYSIRQLSKILAGRSDEGSIGKWRRGERPVPQWARDMLATHFASIEEQARRDREELQKEKAPTRKAGARNLAIWKATRCRHTTRSEGTRLSASENKTVFRAES